MDGIVDWRRMRTGISAHWVRYSAEIRAGEGVRERAKTRSSSKTACVSTPRCCLRRAVEARCWMTARPPLFPCGGQSSVRYARASFDSGDCVRTTIRRSASVVALPDVRATAPSLAHHERRHSRGLPQVSPGQVRPELPWAKGRLAALESCQICSERTIRRISLK